MLISLKADDKIQSSWKDILFSHIVFFLFSMLCIVFMTAYLIYMLCKRKQNDLVDQKFPGAMFIYFNTFGFCNLSALPLFYFLFGIPIWSVCLVETFMFIVLTIYIIVYRKSIVIFFCTLN